jgi:hypothetical protein
MLSTVAGSRNKRGVQPGALATVKAVLGGAVAFIGHLF